MLDRGEVEAIVKVPAKSSGAHFVPEGFVRCGKDAYIDLAHAMAADRFDALGLQNPQKPDLHRGRDIADLVGKGCPWCRASNRPVLPGMPR